MQSTEIWRPVVGYEGLYEVSSHGSVRRIAGGCGATPGRVLRLDTTKRGYKRVRLSAGQARMRAYFVHRLVLEAFVSARPEGMVCCHADDNPSNNYVTNLSWGTQSQNIRQMFARGRSHWDARETCNYGHPLVEPNLVEWIKKRGGASCKACQRAIGFAKGRRIEVTQALRDEKFRDIMNGVKRMPSL